MKKCIKVFLVGLIVVHSNQTQCGLSIGYHALKTAGSTSIGKATLVTISGAASLAACVGSILFLAASRSPQQKITKQNRQAQCFTPLKESIDQLNGNNSGQTIPHIEEALRKFEESKAYKDYPCGFWYGQMQERWKKVLSLHQESSDDKVRLVESIRLFKESAGTFVNEQKKEQTNLCSARNELLKISGLWALISSALGAYCYVKATS